MVAPVSTSAGSKIYIGTTATNPVGDSYTEISEVTNVGEFGRTYDPIIYSSLGLRAKKKFKGPYDEGTITLTLGHSAGDAGQAAAAAALNSDLEYNFKITLNDASTVTGALPTTYLFKAAVFSYKTSIGNNMQVVAATIDLGIDSTSMSITLAT